jgi:hypothetical protein
MADVLKQLQIGQVVSLKELESDCHLISVLAAEQTGQKIVEIGADYIVLDDEAAGVRTQIPVHLIKTIQPSAASGPQAA